MYEMENIKCSKPPTRECQPWINKPQTGVSHWEVPLMYHIVTIWRVPPPLLNYGLLIRWEFQDPKLEVPIMYKAYIRPM